VTMSSVASPRFDHLSNVRSAPRWSMGSAHSPSRQPATPGPQYSTSDAPNSMVRREPCASFGTAKSHRSYDGDTTCTPSPRSLSSTSPSRATSNVGPGSHNPKYPGDRHDRQVSMGTAGRDLDPIPRSKDVAQAESGKWRGRQLQSPGPGAYSPDHDSNRRGSPKTAIGRCPRNIRAKDLHEPGPTQYSARRNTDVSPSWGFGAASRGLEPTGLSDVPGPGSYQVPRAGSESPQHSLGARRRRLERGGHDVQFLPQCTQFVS